MELMYKKGQSFLSEDLRKSTCKIRACGDGIRRNYFKVAVELSKIDNGQYYIEDNFQSTVEYAEKVFGIKKSSAYAFITIGESWVLEDGSRTVLTESGSDYSISQIGALLPLGSEKAIELANDGKISPDMSVRELKAIVKKVQQEEGDPEDPGESEGEGDPGEGSSEIAQKGNITFYDDGEIAITGDFPEWFVIELETLYKKIFSGE